MEAFEILDDTTIERLIPKVGTILKFKKAHHEYLINNKPSQKKLVEKRASSPQTMTSTKKLKTDQNFSVDLDLEFLLGKSLKGEIVLDNRGLFQNIHRQYMVNYLSVNEKYNKS
jgi:hypothetical protein